MYYLQQQSTSLDNVRKLHNYSVTIESSHMEDPVEDSRLERDRVNERKRSMPPA